MYFEVLNISAVVGVSGDFSIQKKKKRERKIVLPGPFLFFSKRSVTLELTPYVVPEIPGLLKSPADMFQSSSLLKELADFMCYTF